MNTKQKAPYEPFWDNPDYAKHKAGCPAGSGYGHGKEPCICKPSTQTEKALREYKFNEHWELLGFAQRAVELLKWFNENIPSPECSKLLDRWKELQKN